MTLRTLIILQGYDPSGPTVRTFYLTNATPFITTPSETPASQSFDAVLSQPLDVRRRVQSVQGGAVRPTLGEVRIHNQDGAYDAWLAYAFDGRAIEVRVGPESGAYPSEYPVMFTGQIDRLDVQGDEIVVRVRDAMAALDAPLADTLYAGDNVPPDGLEGGEELEGRVKPLAYGVVKNVPLVPVNTSKLIYQVSDNAAQAVQAVRDNGVLLGIYTPVDFGALTSISSFGANLGCAVVAGDSVLVGGFNGANPAVVRSTNGTSYTVVTTGFAATQSVRGLAYSPTLDRVCAVTSGGEIATSDDEGVTWTPRTPAAAAAFRRVRWDEKRALFIATGDAGVIHTSPTGVTWTAQTSGTAQILYDVAVNGPSLVAVGAAGAVTRSEDGMTWAAQTMDAVARALCYWTGSSFVTASLTGASVWYSSDGTAFVLAAITTPSAPSTITDIVTFNGWTVVTQTGSVGEWMVYLSRTGGVTWVQERAFALSGGGWAIAPFLDRFYVYGNGGELWRSGAPATYASLADLEDNALEPMPGTYKWIADAAGTYLRLGGTPAGTLLCDAAQGATAANRTAAELFKAVLTRAGYTSSDWVAGDLTALDTADNSELGLYIDDETTVAEALDAIAQSVGAWWGVDADGKFRIAQLTAPSGSSTFTITANDIRGRLERLASSDPLLGLPSFRTSLRYALADTLTLDGTVVETDTAVQTAHLLAGATVEDTLYTQQADAQAEATRRQTLRGVARSAYRVTVSLADYASVDLGAVGTLRHPRFGLSGGALVRVLGVEPDARNRSVTLTLWR